MKILIIRHGIAEDGEGKADAQRRLTSHGRRRMRRIAKAIRKQAPQIDLLATSPLARAVETGEIVAEQYKSLSAVAIAPLSPGKTPMALLQWVQKHPSNTVVALVGHEPSLGIFVSWLLTGLQDSFVELKKGGACMLELDGELRAGRAKLLWLMKPSQARKLV